MVDAVILHGRRLPLLLALLALPAGAPAHQLDEYLQGTLVAIGPKEIRFQINLTPGAAVAEQVLSLIDRNRDGMTSTNETAAYTELLKRDLAVRLDRRNVELRLAACYFPEPEVLRTGCGIIQVEYLVTPGVLAAGPHQLAFENRHLPVASGYLFNAAQSESASVGITGQKRNESQSVGEIVFDFHPPANPAVTAGMAVSLAAALFVVLFAGAWQARKKQRLDLQRPANP
jgi:hypothetical protein